MGLTWVTVDDDLVKGERIELMVTRRDSILDDAVVFPMSVDGLKRRLFWRRISVATALVLFILVCTVLFCDVFGLFVLCVVICCV